MKKLLTRVFSMHPLALIAAVCIIPLSIEAWMLMHTARLNYEQHDLRNYVGTWLTSNVSPAIGKLGDLPDKLVSMVNAQLTDTRKSAESQMSGVASNANDAIKDVTARADKRIGDTLDRIDRALTLGEGVRSDLQPVLKAATDTIGKVGSTSDSATKLTTDLQDSWDTLWPDIQGTSDSATVAVTQLAQFFQVFNTQTSPAIDGIASDVHDATHNLDIKYFHPPKAGFWGRVKQVFTDLEAILIAALRGGVL